MQSGWVGGMVAGGETPQRLTPVEVIGIVVATQNGILDPAIPPGEARGLRIPNVEI
jgi:hypothetical protein